LATLNFNTIAQRFPAKPVCPPVLPFSQSHYPFFLPSVWTGGADPHPRRPLTATEQGLLADAVSRQTLSSESSGGRPASFRVRRDTIRSWGRKGGLSTTLDGHYEWPGKTSRKLSGTIRLPPVFSYEDGQMTEDLTAGSSLFSADQNIRSAKRRRKHWLWLRSYGARVLLP